MTDSLRDRIAAAISSHNMRLQSPKRGAMWVCQCGTLSPRYADHLADAVIAALGLREEFGALDDQDGGVLADAREELLPLYPKETIKRRFITDWENDEVQ